MAILWDHHIIPKIFARHEAFQGIDIDASENRIYLPQDTRLAADMGVSPHPGGHLDSYNEVGKVLDRILKEFTEPAARRAEIRKLQDAMRIALANGDLYMNYPAIDVNATSINNALLADYDGYLKKHQGELRAIRELERRGLETRQDHLIQWSPYLGNPERESLLGEAIATSRGVNVTSENRDLGGTPWQPSSVSANPIPYSYPTPGFTPLNPQDIPTVPGSTVPSLDWLNKPEEFVRSDPRLSHGLPAFPAIDPTRQGLGALPPSVATPQDPLVLQFNRETGAPLAFFSDGSPVMGPPPPEPDRASALAALIGTGAAGALFLAPWLWPVLVAGLGTAAIVPASAAGASQSEAMTAGGGVFSTGAAPYNAFGGGQPNNDGYSSAPSPIELKPLDQQPLSAVPFTDRFGNWTETPAGTMPVQASGVLAGPSPDTAEAVAPEDVRRLTRVNASNSANAFTSGTSPVPYLASSEFDGRFGNWSASSSSGRSQQANRPVGAFADEPSYFIPPPIWGLEDQSKSRNDADDWFSRRIQPLLRQD